ncbi:hypothetical protein Kpol_2000p93 [Vanderwaltozyma polyspora DSM 70294]|uniref:Nitroreductase domain-containing protein n=1 Tax=Vanderwaltozyma polyspora (strain ATCC 22028 / DSM 70294 / BCRC 21397 / CBS 2163 / NBRC 10782 / NRRL Y-8283 / UCD 57-17) TaxID=436907 RepID=A7TFA0_VANPO|nr:uncharacterized protein Kpol_2000p93 [Vanderwaltozyma polyspora DSM 70294]EDO19125.1 hypothetical protein Kpol_2000p93 [Vanderwaltozyma polyspora DSM 70294]
MASATPYLNAVSTRRTIYSLKPQLPAGVSIQDVQSTIQTVVKDTPTSFNSQSVRAVILTGESHKKAWDHVVKSLPEGDAQMRPKSIRDEAYGSVIFFSDGPTVAKLQEGFPAYSALFPQWADHSNGAAQIHSWTALELQGLGCHLQHYNPFVQAALPSDIPADWTVQAQLVFGAPAGAAGEKTFIENPVKTYK